MISVEVTGGKKQERELIDSLANFCVKKLMPRKKNLDIEIFIRRNFETKTGLLGGVVDTQDTNTFEMEICHTMSFRKKLLTIAHEMVHVKQFTRGELKHTECMATKSWKGKNYHESNYWNCPWEIEAYGRELGLFVMWVDECRIEGDFTIDPT